MRGCDDRYCRKSECKKQMKILSVSSGYYPAHEVGGIAVTVHGLNCALVKAGHLVTVVASNKFLEGKLEPLKKYDFGGVNCIYFPVLKKLEVLSEHGWQFSFPMIKYLIKSISFFDIIHINGTWNFPSAISALICFLQNKRKNSFPQQEK